MLKIKFALTDYFGQKCPNLYMYVHLVLEFLGTFIRVTRVLQLSCGGTFFMPKVENFTQIFPSAKPTTLHCHNSSSTTIFFTLPQYLCDKETHVAVVWASTCLQNAFDLSEKS